LASTLEQATESGARIFPIAWHVDYWDYLGWTDPYGSAAYTQRQEDLSASLGLSGLYTPQMVVNASWEFVGSNSGALNNALSQAGATPVEVSVTLWPEIDEGGNIDLEYDVLDAPPGTELHIALVERGLVTQVPSGENAGLALEGENVVRGWMQVDPEYGAIVLDPGDVDVEQSSLVGWVEDPVTMTISGATYVDL
jgi:hypothetical protein